MVNCIDTVKLCDPENPLFGLRISAIFITQAEKWLIFLLKLATFRYHGNKARPKVNFVISLNCVISKNPFGARISAISLI